MSNITKDTLEKICSAYEIAEGAILMEEVNEGYLSHNFILKNNRSLLFLKQYRFDDRNKIEEIHRAKFFFHQGGIPIILPFKNREGYTIFENEGKYYALFPFVEGRIIRRRDRSLRAFISAGKMLAKLHALSTKFSLPQIENKEKGWSKEGFLQKAKGIREKIENLPQQTPFDSLVLQSLDHKTRLVKNNEVHYEDFNFQNDHLIHGDYYGGNIFYDENEEVNYVFDIENAKMAPRAMEIARAIDYMCFSNEYGYDSFHAARSFLASYQGIYPLSHEELTRGIVARYLDKAHSLWIEEEHYLKDNYRVDCFLQGELDMLSYYSNNCSSLIEKLRLREII